VATVPWAGGQCIPSSPSQSVATLGSQRRQSCRFLGKELFERRAYRHVVTYADDWQQPIRLHHFPSSTTTFLRETDRTIFSDQDTDSAVILAHPGELQLPENTIPLLPTSISLDIGTEVGWLGFPALASTTLCFFSGNISARQEWRHAYLIDGVAINGVSGGPVIHSTETDGVQIVGTISAYVSNRATGDTLPGLSIARDVTHFHDTISTIKSLDEAREHKQTTKDQKTDTPSSPPSDIPTDPPSPSDNPPKT